MAWAKAVFSQVVALADEVRKGLAVAHAGKVLMDDGAPVKAGVA
jgi:hypothetical protein